MRSILRSLAVPLVFAVAAFGTAACTFGGNVAELSTIQSGEGVPVELRSPNVAGELLALEAEALLVRTATDTLVRVPFDAAAFLELDGRERVQLPPNPSDRERLRLRSRYPQGVSDDLLASLLRTYGQERVTVAGDSR